MLVLTRSVGQKIELEPDGIVIQVCRIERGKVRLGVTAPPEVQILRNEVRERDDRAEGGSEQGRG